MLSWLKYCVAIIGRAFLTMAALVVAVAFGIAVQHQFGGSFWVHARFPAFCRFPLRLALVLHRSKALEKVPIPVLPGQRACSASRQAGEEADSEEYCTSSRFSNRLADTPRGLRGK